MEDPNLIACLYPADGNEAALAVIRMHKGSARYITPQGGTKPEPEHGSRASTISREDDGDLPQSYPGLQLTFNHGPKVGQEFVLGTDKNCCDVFLPKVREISRRYCCLTFDAKGRLILRDLSKHGVVVIYDGQGGEKRRTIVTYNDQGQEKRYYFTWILSGSEASEVRKIVVEIERIRFQVIVSKHETYPNLYHDNVDRFLLEGNIDNELPFGALGIQSTTSTAQQSGA